MSQFETRAEQFEQFNFQPFIPVEYALNIKEAEKILDGKRPERRSLKDWQPKEAGVAL